MRRITATRFSPGTRAHACFIMLALVLVLASTPVAAAEAGAQPAAGKAPVASVRVAFDRDAIIATHATGMADIASGRHVSADDPVRIASVSKLVVALGVMRLVEQGKLDLDADVSRSLGWTLRHPKWPDVPVTLRLLLSHRSGLTDDAGYWQTPLGGRLQGLLDQPGAWDASHAPGEYWRYSNLNFPLVAMIMEDATGERFDRLMERLVLQPLHIAGCYNWESCDAATAARAVVLYSEGKPVRDDHQGRKPSCAVITEREAPCDLSQWRAGENGALFSPQGGLRISANGLARIGRLLLGDGSVDGVRLLSAASVDVLLTPLWTYAPGNGLTQEEDVGPNSDPGMFCRYGLASQTLATANPDCGDDLFGDGIARVGHAGNAYGLLSGLWLDREAGTGVAYFATGVDDPEAGAHSSFNRIEEKLAGGE